MANRRMGSTRRAHSVGGSTTWASASRPIHVAHAGALTESFGGSSGSKASAKRAANTKGRTQSTPLILQMCKAVNLLVEEPLQALRSSILHTTGDARSKIIAASSLAPLVELLDAMLYASHELVLLLHSEDVVGSRISRLLDGQQGLVQYSQTAGKSLRNLAADACQQGVAARLRALQENLAEALDGVRFQWQREDARRHEKHSESEAQQKLELAELRNELCEARGRTEGLLEQGAAERKHWCHEVEEHAQNSILESGAIDKRHWDSLFSEVSRLTQNTDGAHRLAETYEAQAAQRERELKALRERTDAVVIEMRCSEDGAQAQRACSLAELRQLDLARESALRELNEERVRCEVMAGAIVRSEKSEEHLSSRFAAELAQERRERSSLSLQLNEAVETISDRDNAIESLRRSLCEELERARHPPVAASVPLMPSALGQSFDGRVDPSPSFHAQRRSLSAGAPPIPPFPKLPATPDGTSSVCRISTDSAKFASRAVLEPSRDAQDKGLFVTDRPTWISRYGNSVEPVYDNTVITSPAKIRETSNDRIRQFVGAERPWELSPKEFLAQWRRSRTSLLPSSNNSTMEGTPQRSVSHMHDVSVPLSAETLRITASFQ